MIHINTQQIKDWAPRYLHIDWTLVVKFDIDNISGINGVGRGLSVENKSNYLSCIKCYVHLRYIFAHIRGVWLPVLWANVISVSPLPLPSRRSVSQTRLFCTSHSSQYFQYFRVASSPAPSKTSNISIQPLPSSHDDQHLKGTPCSLSSYDKQYLNATSSPPLPKKSNKHFLIMPYYMYMWWWLLWFM